MQQIHQMALGSPIETPQHMIFDGVIFDTLPASQHYIFIRY